MEDGARCKLPYRVVAPLHRMVVVSVPFPIARLQPCAIPFRTEVKKMSTQSLPACCQRKIVGGHEQYVIKTAAGQAITLTDGAGSIVIQDTGGNSIRLENGKITVNSPGRLVLKAAIVEINGSTVEVNAATLRCSGVVQADTVIANSVSAASYTPGAGNVW